jgi:uncharacterized repeat protein (TIGR01451 family)
VFSSHYRICRKARLKKAASCFLLSIFFVARPCLALGPPPVIIIQPASQTVPINNSVTFSVTASSLTTLSYQWLKNASDISGATSNSFTITNVQTNDQAVYSVKVTNAGGSVTSANATLTVVVPPGITTQPQSQGVAQGQNVSFSVVPAARRHSPTSGILAVQNWPEAPVQTSH